MEDVERLVKVTMDEIEEMLTTKRVVGEPIEAQGRTLIPLVSLGFGFGAGGGAGSGTAPRGGNGSSRGVIEKDGVHVEPVRGAAASVFEKFGETIGKVVEQRAGRHATGEHKED